MQMFSKNERPMKQSHAERSKAVEFNIVMMKLGMDSLTPIREL
jgi:hypothetical protein